MDTSRVKLSQFAAAMPRLITADKDYTAINRATQQRIQWQRIVNCPEWKWRENVRSISIYTKQERLPTNGFCVLATGLVKGTMREIAALLDMSSQEEFEDLMLAHYGQSFKHGTYIGDVATREWDAHPSDQLSIRSATFASRCWLRQRESWCLLDSSKYAQDGSQFEKYMTALPLQDVLVQGQDDRAHEFNCLENVICGIRVQAQETFEGEPVCARIHFFAELVPPSATVTSPAMGGRYRQSNRQELVNAIQKRMIHFARGCERLSQLVRRRRLGSQVLMNPRSAPPLGNPQCFNCDKVVLFAKLCRVCGNAVCKDCSESYERETRPPHVQGPRIDKVRVCDPCLAHIECADYSHSHSASLAESAEFHNHVPSNSADGDLKDLLQVELLRASSPQRRDAVLSVLRCVLDQERDPHNSQLCPNSSFSSSI
jgi:hypothetical protein